MKSNGKVAIAIAALVLVAFPMRTDAQTHISFRLHYGAPRVSRYYESLAEYYNVPYRAIREMREAGVCDDDMPGILYIYTHSHYSLRQIYSLRLRGATWENLSNWCGVPLSSSHSGPPYGNAYGHYRDGAGNCGHDRQRWNREEDDQRGGWEGTYDQEERSQGDDEE